MPVLKAFSCPYLFALLLPFWLCATGWAAPPPNDLCSGAEVIPAAGPFPYYSALADVSGATTNSDPPAPACWPLVSRSVWYHFTPAASGFYTLSVSDDTATTVPDTVMAVYTSAGDCAGPFTAVQCNDDAGSRKSGLSLVLSATTNYFIVVWVSSASPAITNGDSLVQLKVSQPVAPPNDLCSGAEVIPGNGPFPYLSAVADTALATTNSDPPTPQCQSSCSRSVWYRFTPATTAAYTLSTCADTATTVFDTLMAIYTAPAGCGGPFTEVACNDNACGFRAAITTTLTAGVTYYVVVWETGAGAPVPGETLVQLRVSGFLPPLAVSLPATSLSFTGAVLRATVNPNGVPTTAWFDWGPSTNFANATAPQGLGNGSAPLSLAVPLSGFANNRACFFHIHATNNLGAVTGTNLSFTCTRPALLAVERLANSVFNVQFSGASSQFYFVQGSTNLVDWTVLGAPTDLGNGAFVFGDTNTVAFVKRFYRVFAP
jgi:hypothetical protein